MNQEAQKNGTTVGDEALKEIYKKLRPGEPPLVESAQILINNLFFDPKRYDLANVGRYKFDKKMGIAKRIAGKTLAQAVVSPITGELLYDAGVFVTREIADLIEKAGVNEVVIYVEEEKTLKIFSNGMVYPETVFGFDLKDAGINEKARLSVLLEIAESCEGDKERIIEAKNVINDSFGAVNFFINGA
jgi:DNA-directed RNA polymerase subunit beta